MSERVTESTMEEYEAFLRQSPKGNFAQSILWSKQKPMWKWVGLLSRDSDGTAVGAMSVLIRKIPGLGCALVYGCRAPVCDIHNKDVLYDLLDGVKAVAKASRAYVIKIDPDVPSSDTEFAKLLTDYGFRIKDGGANFEAIQPKYVFRLDVSGKTEDEVLAAFHQKTRYNLRVAVKKGVEVRICGKEMVPDFARLMLETGVRDGFVTRQASYFSDMLDNLGEHARLYMAFSEDIPIAGTLAIHYGDKVWYLYGASSNEHRNLMPNYLLQWNMIQWAIAEGCRVYDFRGVSGDISEDNPLYGLYKFKKGFGGEFVEFVGEMDLVLNRFVYHVLEWGICVFKELRRRLYLIINH